MLTRSTKNRELLEQLESENKYVFHGSERGDLKELEPRQSYTIIDGKNVEDDIPAIHATPFADVAILLALINEKNCPKGFKSGFRWNGEAVLYTDKRSVEQLNENSKGFVYILNKKDFEPREKIQEISYKKVKVVQVVEVGSGDLPEGIEIREGGQ